MSMRRPSVCCFFLLLALILPCVSFAQFETATLSGRITDPDGRSVPKAQVQIVNIDTNVASKTETNDEGIYVVTGIQPGRYRLLILKDGFHEIIRPEFVLNVQDHIEQNFRLQVGSVSESITVEANAVNVNTTDATVSTVVDRKFVENMPLNGRSFQSLILLTPGVVTTSPMIGASSGSTGEFSVNGQRTESNYYSVDGVSANLGIAPGALNGASAGISGSVPSATALGTTQSLVSLDALQEFRVQGSTYSAEYGRNPGGQFAFATRAGNNQWHGTAFDYLRNNFFDANDWFNDALKVPEPPLRQNDFGGTLGGPIQIPHVYDGKDKTFFFFSYEGLRLLQPQAAGIYYVPNAYLRACAPSAIQPVLNVFPKPTVTGISPDCSNPDPGNGQAVFNASWSNPSSLDAYSIRLDQNIGPKTRLFFRFGSTPSSSVTRSSAVPSEVDTQSTSTRTYTFGAINFISSRFNNEFRLNYTSNQAVLSQQLSQFGGAQPANLAQLQGIDTKATPDYSMVFGFFFAQPMVFADGATKSIQRQWNVVDTVSLSKGSHEIKLGVDYRRLSPIVTPSNPEVDYFYFSENSVLGNNADSASAQSLSQAFPLYRNFSAFVQDQWKLSGRFSLSMGLRWEVNPAPGVTQGLMPYTLAGANDLATMTLAPPGTRLWPTKWYDLAPRVGGAYILRNTPGFETVVRAGAGIFYDTAQQVGSYGFQGPGFSGQNNPTGTLQFPIAGFGVPPAIQNPPMAPYTNTNVFAYPNLQLPYTLQTNLSVEQLIGKAQTVTVSYVGAFGRKLLEQLYINAEPINSNFGYVNIFRNGPSSDYNALQVKVQRAVSKGLQALGSYTFSHCLDYGSENLEYPYQRGNCEYDVRHNFAGAITYELPSVSGNKFAVAMLDHWAVDDRFSVRTGFPVPLAGTCSFLPSTQQQECLGLNLVSGQPVYVYGAECASIYGAPCPGGRAINVNAFELPPAGEFGDAPRNFARGFGAWQMDLAVRREFPIYENLKLQFRAEAFNVFNHPNFGSIDSFYSSGSTTFGTATATLARSLGGVSQLYQMGGPRSMQFALKLIF